MTAVDRSSGLFRSAAPRSRVPERIIVPMRRSSPRTFPKASCATTREDSRSASPTATVIRRRSRFQPIRSRYSSPPSQRAEKMVSPRRPRPRRDRRLSGIGVPERLLKTVSSLSLGLGSRKGVDRSLAVGCRRRRQIAWPGAARVVARDDGAHQALLLRRRHMPRGQRLNSGEQQYKNDRHRPGRSDDPPPTQIALRNPGLAFFQHVFRHGGTHRLDPLLHCEI